MPRALCPDGRGELCSRRPPEAPGPAAPSRSTPVPEVNARQVRLAHSRRFALGLAALLALAFAAYTPVLSAGFLDWDDQRYLAAARAGVWLEPVLGNLHPLTMASLGLDHALFGEDPLPYHAENLAWHLLNIGLVAGLALRLGTGVLGGLALAVFFGLHPMRVESVAWVSERKDVLSTFFFLASIAAYLGHRRATGLRRSLGYGLSLLAGALALAAKPMAVTLPVVLLAIDWRDRRSDWGRVLAEKLPFLALSLLTGLATLSAQEHGDGAVFDVQRLDAPARLASAAQALVFYTSRSLWPSGLSAYYDIALVRLSLLDYALAGVGALGLALGMRGDPARRRDVLLGLAFFAITLAPTLKLVPFGGNSIFNDRYLYLPSVGLGLAAVAALRPWLLRHARPLAVATAALAVALAVASWQRTEVFHDSEQLWLDVLRQYPETATAHNHLGRHYLDTQDDLERSEAAFRRAIASRPELPESHFNLGLVLERTGRLEEAEASFRRAFALRPGSVETGLGVGNFFLRQGREEEAIELWQPLAESPGTGPALFYNLGIAYGRTDRLDAARRAFRRAIELDGSFGPAHASLAVAYLRDRNPREALASFERARALGHPVDPAMIESLRGRLDESRAP